MDGTDASGGKWLKYSCLGCLGMVALVILVVAGILGLAWNKANSARVEEQVLTRDLPAPEETPGLPPESIAADMPDAGHLAAGSPAGRVVLDLSDADFHISPGVPGEPARVEATYDLDSYKLEETLEQGEDGTWVYAVRFHREGSWSIIGILSEMISGHSPRVTLILPPDSPIALDLDLHHGGARIDLGGLWLTSADFGVSMGGFDVRFSEPLREPIERLSIDASMGGAVFGFIGNASPRALEVSHRMGGMELDLRGRWSADARIEVSSSMGGAVVRLPLDVGIDGLDSAGRNRTGPEGAPTLTFVVDTEMGELEFVD